MLGLDFTSRYASNNMKDFRPRDQSIEHRM